jgi:hypothetical protein
MNTISLYVAERTAILHLYLGFILQAGEDRFFPQGYADVNRRQIPQRRWLFRPLASAFEAYGYSL